jgi:hypothetical protein
LQDVKKFQFGIAAFIFSVSTRASASASAQGVTAVADGVNIRGGQWHFDAALYGWVPWIYSTANLPPIAGGIQTVTTEPHQYLKHLEDGVLVDSTVRKGGWSLWTDSVFLNLKTSAVHGSAVRWHVPLVKIGAHRGFMGSTFPGRL